MELSHQMRAVFYDTVVTKFDTAGKTARDKGQGTRDKGTANTAYTARDEGRGTGDKGAANINEE